MSSPQVEVAGKVFLITGAATGLGAAYVRAFLEEGAKHVAILDLAQKDGEAQERELNAKYGSGKVKFFKCDATDEDALSNAFKSTINVQKRIDVVINNAGLMNDKKDIYKKMIDLNVTALITSSLKAYELMRADRGGAGGTIINIASTLAITPIHQLPIYCATKSAVLMFSKCLGMEPHYSRSQVRLLTICFHSTNTALLHKSKYGAFDAETASELDTFIQGLHHQRVESGVSAVLQAFKRGKSASTWAVVDDKAPIDITSDIEEGFAAFTQGLFD